MFASRVLLGYLLALLLVFQAASAQQPANPTPVTPAVGLLLARVARERNPDLESRFMVKYETLWIVRDPAGAHIAARLSDIIVPRKSGFWRIGIEHTCQFEPPWAKGDPKDHGNISTEDVAYAVPVGDDPTVEVGNQTCNSETARRLFDDSYDPVNGDPHSGQNAPSECGWISQWIESVLPDLISISYFQGASEACDPRGGNTFKETWVQSPDDPVPSNANGRANQQIPFDFHFGAAGRRAWIRAISGRRPDGTDSCVTDNLEGMEPTGWSLKHFRGEWRTSAFVQVGRVCVASGDPKVAVPRSLTHAIPLPISWAALERQLPGISDAYVSPGASILLAVSSDKDASPDNPRIVSVALFDFSKNTVGQKLLDLPPSKIVLAEWATGRFVQSWTDSLTALQSKGLPAVVIKVHTSN